MKYLNEFRDPDLAQKLFEEIHRITTQHWAIMEVCGGQTHSIIRNGIDQLLPDKIELIHGPGCPVCVTPLEIIDKALAIAARPGVIFCSFGDMVRVPGSEKDLFRIKSEGGDIRIVYSPLDAVKIAQDNPDKEVVFFAIGFETTAPANAMAVSQAKRLGLTNFSVLVSHVLVPPAIEAILSSPSNRVQAFLAAGHVCSVMGTWQYEPLVEKYQVPIVVTGFEPLDILQGIRQTVQQLENGRSSVENAYARAVQREGNLPAQKMLADIFQVTDRTWRGIGEIPQSGWKLSRRTPPSTPKPNSTSATSTPPNHPSATAAKCCKDCSSPTNAPPSAKNAPRANPWAPPWSPAKAPVPAYYQYGRFINLEA